MASFCKFLEYFFCEWQVFENFKFKCQPIRKKNMKKTVKSRNIQLMFLSRPMERQAGCAGKTVVID